MKGLTLQELEDEIAKGCGNWREQEDAGCRRPCGSGFCNASEEHECRSIPVVRVWMKTPGVVGVVLFRNNDMCSSSLGRSSCVVVGEGKTHKTVEECEGKWLNDLPSQRQYAECFVKV